MPHALVVENDSDTAASMVAIVAAQGYTVATAPTLRSARQQLALQAPDVVLLDLTLPDGTGLELVNDIRVATHADIVLTATHASVQTSVQALRLGAADYLTKPVNADHLRGVMQRLKRRSTLPVDAAQWQALLQREGSFGPIWGRSAPMRVVYDKIVRVAGTSVAVFVTGESGTGKELVARAVHQLSRRSAKPFLAVNCGAISPQLIESEIFGHEKGSFTGAERQHLGFFERANGGTLLLDEISEMPLDLQVKLLRVLETGTFMRVGSMQQQEADVRIIAASNRDMRWFAESGKLREDLWYRLNVFPIQVPALRERPTDIALIAAHFLRDISRIEGVDRRFSAFALQSLTQYAWPGNVRELRNIVQRAYVMAHADTIDDLQLPAPVDAPPTPSAPKGMITVDLGSSLADVQRTLTLATLDHFGSHKERTAAALGISLKTLYNRLKEYGATTGAEALR